MCSFYNDAYWNDDQPSEPREKKQRTTDSWSSGDVMGRGAARTERADWPLRYEKFSECSEHVETEAKRCRFRVKVPESGDSIRKSSNAKKPTCLCITFDEADQDRKLIPLKISSRLRSPKRRGELASRIKYVYSDGKSIWVGGGTTKIQILPSTKTGDTPQAYLVPEKTGFFDVCTEDAPMKTRYILEYGLIQRHN
mmetsp:Transcript_25772/g.50214  ORF Transcript_25772/g.50214 Transcript_25772/m.50214 type:complete len:196 (+) Transcript_25772:97-684(+)